MAKYDVTMSCGHVETVQLYGPHTDRDRKIKYLEASGLCRECNARQRDEDRERQSRQAADANREVGLPELTGTPKQIAWAETLRAAAIARLDEQFGLDRMIVKTDSDRLIAWGMWDYRTWYCSHTEAKHWIDSRDERVTERQVEDWLCEHRADVREEIVNIRQQAAIQEQAERRKQDERDATEQVEAGKRQAERETRDAELSGQTAQARDFEVAGVEITDDNIAVNGADGRTARGYIDEGEWVVYEVDGEQVDSEDAEIERIARDAKAMSQQAA